MLAAPRGVMDIEVTDAPEMSVGGLPSVPSRISVVLVEEAKAGGTRLGCPCDDQNIRLLAGVAKPASVTVCEDSLGSPCVGGMLSSSDIADIEVTNAPELSGGGPPSVPSRISVVLVEEAKAGGTPRLGCPRDDQNIRLLAGVAKPASVTVCEDSLASPCVWGTLSSSDIAGRLLPVVPAGISFPVGHVDPAGPYVACGPVGPFGTMSPSDSDPAGPAGLYVAGDPVGPDGTLSPFISDPAGPAGPYVAGGPVGPFGTLSPSDPAGPYVAGDPVGPNGTLSPFISDPAGPYDAGGPIGPYGTLSPFSSDPAGPDDT